MGTKEKHLEIVPYWLGFHVQCSFLQSKIIIIIRQQKGCKWLLAERLPTRQHTNGTNEETVDVQLNNENKTKVAQTKKEKKKNMKQGKLKYLL
jgi:hypothetical protein